jgi:hypothetical protein
MNQFTNQAVEQGLRLEIRPEHAGIVVGCPEGHGQPMPLGEFAKTERGQEQAADIIDMVDNYDMLKASGKDEETSLRRAFGAIALKEEGRVVVDKEVARKAAEAAKKK